MNEQIKLLEQFEERLEPIYEQAIAARTSAQNAIEAIQTLRKDLQTMQLNILRKKS